MVNTFTENFDIMGDMTIDELISFVDINPLSVVHTPSQNCSESYDITFKTFEDMMTFSRGYFGDYSDTQIRDIMGW